MSRRLRILLGVAGGLLLALSIPVFFLVGSEGPAVLVLGGFLAFPGAVLLLTALSIPIHDKRLKRRARRSPPVPSKLSISRRNERLDLATVPLPLFDRPLTNLWSTITVVRERQHELKVFEVVHADLLGEGQPRLGWYRDLESGELVPAGQVIVSCVLAEVDAQMPLVVVRSRFAKPITWPRGLVERETELEAFNRSFRLLSADQYAATAIVDARTMRAITELDRRFSIEVGGRWILLYAAHLDTAGIGTLIAQAADFMETFPRVVRSLYGVRDA
jgi:hypothetical protein